MIGKKTRVLVDEYEGTTAICRSEGDSPDVDLTYRVDNCNATPGEFIEVEITDALPFDFIARKIN